MIKTHSKASECRLIKTLSFAVSAETFIKPLMSCSQLQQHLDNSERSQIQNWTLLFDLKINVSEVKKKTWTCLHPLHGTVAFLGHLNSRQDLCRWWRRINNLSPPLTQLNIKLQSTSISPSCTLSIQWTFLVVQLRLMGVVVICCFRRF